MNKRILLIISIIILVAVFGFFILNNNEVSVNPNLPSVPNTQNNEKTVEVTDTEKIEKIKEDSYLNILLQIKAFDSLNVNHELLLEAAMRIAGKLDLYQVPTSGAYIEYVPRNIIHELIYELSGIRINEPIIIEDFYYLYDTEGDYYYIVPIGSDWLELKDISSIHYTSSSDQYIINCSAENITDYALKTIYPNVDVRLKYKASNNYVKYQLISINAGKSSVEEISIDDTFSGEDEFYYNNVDENDYSIEKNN